MHLETQRWISLFTFLKLIDKLEHIQRIESPVRKKYEIRPHEEFEFLIRRQDKPANMIVIFAYLRIELESVGRSYKELTFGLNIKNNFLMLEVAQRCSSQEEVGYHLRTFSNISKMTTEHKI